MEEGARLRPNVTVLLKWYPLQEVHLKGHGSLKLDDNEQQTWPKDNKRQTDAIR
jgi:hypothetical protein